MAKGRENTAGNLSDVLELLRKQRQSGMLSVEHYQGAFLEEGEVYFQDGQVISAKMGNLSGQEALNAFLRWRQVLYTFQASVMPYAPANAATNSLNRRSIEPTNIPVQEIRGTTGNLPDTPPAIPQFTNRNVPASQDADRPGDYSPDTTGKAVAAPVQQFTPGIEWIIPRRIDTGQNVLSLPLTRTQRSMYLLIDGQRSISDLSRCTRKNMQDVEQLLRELQQRGLVTL
jgi:hypothetical protein